MSGVRAREKEELGAGALFIADVMAQKFEDSALSDSEGLSEKCLCGNVRKALRLDIQYLRAEVRQEAAHHLL